jgi:hypothetical protein
MHRHAFRFAFVFACLLSLLPRAASPAPGRDPQTIRFMGRDFPRPGTDAERAWIARLQNQVASAALRRAALSSAAPVASDSRPTLEAWTTNGVPVVSNTIGQFQPSIVSDGSGGAIVAFLDARNGSADVYANHIDSNGNTAAGWPAAGLGVAVTDSFEVIVTTCSDGAGGAFIAWTVLRPLIGMIADLYLQRITSAGAVGPGFSANGKRYPVGQVNGFDMRADGQGGVYLGWLDSQQQPYLVRLNSTGGFVAGWPGTGIAVGTADNTQFEVAPDGSGGLVRVWASNDSVFATRYAGDGTFSPGWDAAGLLLCTGGFSKSTPNVTRTSSGNFMLAWEDDRNFDIDLFAQMVTPSGMIPAPWPLNGVPICTIAGAQVNVKLVPDLAGGACAAWQDYRGAGTDNSLYANRITSTGAIASGWAANGNALCDVTTISKNDFIPVADNASGINVVWDDDRSGGPDIYVQRLISGGGRPPGFPSGGALLAGTPEDQDSPVATTDGAQGVIAAWDDARSGARVYAGKVLGDGTVGAEAALVSASAEPDRILLRWFAPSGPAFRATLERNVAGSGYAPLATLQADGTGDLHYEDLDVTPGTEYAYRLSVTSNGSTRTLGEVTLRVPQTLAFALSPVRPNPSAGELTAEFTLPSALPASLDVLDVAGRRVLSREVSLGAGRHVVRLGEAADLKAGVYLLRLQQGGRSLTTRAVIAR